VPDPVTAPIPSPAALGDAAQQLAGSITAYIHDVLGQQALPPAKASPAAGQVMTPDLMAENGGATCTCVSLISSTIH
jgi:hypothetical protein